MVSDLYLMYTPQGRLNVSPPCYAFTMMIQKYASLADFDLYACPLCDGVTPSVWCDDCDESHCQYCSDAYGCDGCE